MSTGIDVSGAERNPYVGPQAFRRGEPLYGRDNETADLLDLLIAERVVLLHSPSGAGKSSLIAAGLVPRLEDEGFEVLPVVRVNHEVPPDGLEGRPHNRYSLSTLLSLEEGLPREHLHGIEQLDEMTVTQYLAFWPDLDHQPGNEVLIFDQFEEVITADPNDHDAKAAYFADIGTALRDRNVWALFSIREDFLAELDPYARLVPTRFANRFGLDLLTVDQALEAMTRPAADRGVEFADAAARKLVDDLRRIRVKRPGGITEELGPTVEPVQLQVACRQLWSRRDGRTAIELADVEAVGNVDQALATYYAECVRRTAAETGVSEREVRDWLEHELVTPQGIRNQVLQGPRAEGAAGERVVALLTAAHLVRAESRRGATWYELAHDRLIEPVKENNALWRERNLAPVQKRAIQWDRQGRPDHALLSTRELAEADPWVDENREKLAPLEVEFVEGSRRAEAEAERERRANRRTRQWLLVSVVVGLAAVIAASVAFVEQQRAANLASATEVSALAGRAVRAGQFDVDLSLLLAQRAAALPGVSGDNLDVQDALQLAVSQSPVVQVLRNHGPASTATYSPAGNLIATVHDDRSIVVWDASSGEEQYQLSYDDGGLSSTSVAFSPDGDRIAAVTMSGEVAIWPATPDAGEPTVVSATGGTMAELFASGSGISQIRFSADGSRIAYLGHEGLFVMEESSQQPGSFEDHAFVGVTGTDFAWTADGSQLVIGDMRGLVSLWDARSGMHLDDIATHAGEVVAVEVSGRMVASASYQDGVVVSDLDDLNDHHLYRLDWFGIVDVSFSSDGSRLVVVDDVGTAIAIDPMHTDFVKLVTANGMSPVSISIAPDDPGRAVIATSTGEPATWDVTFSQASIDIAMKSLPNGDVLTVLYDGSVITWSEDLRYRSLVPPSGEPVHNASVDMAGDRIALLRSSGDVEVWSLETSQPVAVLSLDDLVLTVAISPDGRLVAAGDLSGGISIWDVDSGRQAYRLDSHTDGVKTLDFGTDSSRLVSGSWDGTAIVWGLRTESPEYVLRLGTTPTAIAWSDAGTRIAVAGEDGSVQFWDPESGTKVSATGDGHGRPVNDLAFDASGTRLVSGAGDKSIMLWDAISGASLRQVRHGQDPLRVAFFSGDHQIMVADLNLVPSVVYLDGDELLQKAREKTTRELTARECALYLGADANCPGE